MATDTDFMEEGDRLLSFTVEIVTAHIANNSVAMPDVPQFIQNVHNALAALSAPSEPEETAAVPIIDPKRSVKPDHLICLECGKKLKTLKAHLNANHGLTFEAYRERFGLPESYPSVAHHFHQNMRERAINRGLGKTIGAHVGRPGPRKVAAVKP